MSGQRLIDATQIRYEPMLSARGNGMYEDVMVAYKDQIDAMPTIEERKTGKWIIDGHHIRCGQCGNTVCNTDREGDAIPREFCGRCGVMMEGE